MSWKVMKGHGKSFPISRLTFQVRKVIGDGGLVFKCMPQSYSDSRTRNELWSLDMDLTLTK